MQQESPHLPCFQVLQPAIELAEGGFPLSPVTAYFWEQGLHQIEYQGGPGVKSFTTAEGKAPKAGELHRNPELGTTFRAVAEKGAYEGNHFVLPAFLTSSNHAQ